MTTVMQRHGVALLCMVILGAISLVAAAEGANVLVLTADNFDQAVKDHPFLGMSTLFCGPGQVLHVSALTRSVHAHSRGIFRAVVRPLQKAGTRVGDRCRGAQERIHPPHHACLGGRDH